jgi:hypothetical protein
MPWNFQHFTLMYIFPPPVKCLLLIIKVHSLTDHRRDQRYACAYAQFSHPDQRLIPWVMPQLEF